MMKLKQGLKKLSWAAEVNAAIKSRTVKRQYQETVRRYAQMAPPSGFGSLLAAKSPAALQRLRRATRPRIFFVGTDEDQDRSGILQALERIGTLNYFTKVDGRYGHNEPPPDACRRNKNADRLWQLISSLAERGAAPDLLIAQTWACVIDPTVFDKIRDHFGTFIINIAMDDRHQYWGESAGGTYPLIPHIDLALTAAPECVDWYMKEGCPALFFPEASDPDLFQPSAARTKRHDVCFVGARYGIREKIVESLLRAGIRVTVHGSGWPQGRIATDELPMLFAESKIVLGVGTIGHCIDFCALKMRDFDAPMAGSFYLTQDNPDLHEMYVVGEEIATYSSIGDCVAKVRYYLANESEREAIAARGRSKAVARHTWHGRFQSMLETLTATANA